MIPVTCPSCGTESEAPEETAGRRISCGQCDEWFPCPGTSKAIESGRTRRPRRSAARVPPPPVPVVAAEEGPSSAEESEAPTVRERKEGPAPTKEQEKRDGRERPETEEKAQDGAQRQADGKAWLATRGDIGRLLEQVRRIDDKLATVRWAVIASVVVFSVACLVAIVAIVKAI